MVALNKNIFLGGIIVLLVVVLVFVRCQREGMESVYTKKAAIDYPSNKSTASSSTTIAKCKKECDELPTCTGYIFKNPSSCTLKSGELIQPKENEWTDAYIKTPQGAPATQTSVSSAAAVPAKSTSPIAAAAAAAAIALPAAAAATSTSPAAPLYDDFYIGPIKFPSTAEACQIECDKSSTCSGTVVWSKGTYSSWCFLKSTTEVPNGNGHLFVSRSKDPKAGQTSTKDEYYMDKEIPNIKSIEACQKECDSAKNCSGIIYNKTGTSTHCGLKYKTDPGGESSIRVNETMGKSTAAAKPPPAKTPGPPPIVQYSATQS